MAKQPQQPDQSTHPDAVPAAQPTPAPDDALAQRLGVSADQLKGLDWSTISRLVQMAPAFLAMVKQLIDAWQAMPKQATAATAGKHDHELAASAMDAVKASCAAHCRIVSHAAACGAHDH